MNRITATCIAGMRSKTTSRIRIHFFPRPREANPFTRVPPRGRSVLRGFGLGILAKGLRWRPSATRHDSSCASAANPPSSSEHLEHGLQHADDRTVGAVHAFGEPAQAVEVPE